MHYNYPHNHEQIQTGYYHHSETNVNDVSSSSSSDLSSINSIEKVVPCSRPHADDRPTGIKAYWDHAIGVKKHWVALIAWSSLTGSMASMTWTIIQINDWRLNKLAERSGASIKIDTKSFNMTIDIKDNSLLDKFACIWAPCYIYLPSPVAVIPTTTILPPRSFTTITTPTSSSAPTITPQFDSILLLVLALRQMVS
jgi:hypothetical protein